jgi:site-specific DNA recombinase
VNGLQRLLAAAAAPERAFDYILIDDTSRLTRKLADALNLYEKLTFAGVRLVAVSQGVDSDSSQAELLIGVHGLIDQRGESVCENAVLVRRDELEQNLLKGLADSVLRVEVIDYAVARMGEALRQGHEKLNAELERLRQRKQQVEGEIKRLITAIAEGQPSQSLMAAIGERETELRTITNKLVEPGPGSLQATLNELRNFAISRLAKIRELISHPETIDMARAVLAEHFGTFTLEPTIQDGEPVYLAHGKVDFFGEEAMARTGGAGGQNRTGYARLFRAALYH